MRWKQALSAMYLGLLVAGLPVEVVAETPTRTIRVHVSQDTVSRWTEAPSGDHLIPDSQVFVGSLPGASRWLGLLGIAIHTATNEQAAGPSVSTAFRARFDETLTQALGVLVAGETAPEASFVLVDQPYDVKLLPSARFEVDERGQAFLSFRLTVRTKSPDATSEVTRNFLHGVPGLRPLDGPGGWTENDAEAFRGLARSAMERLCQAFALDAVGRFEQSLSPEGQRVVTITPLAEGKAIIRAVLLGQTDEILIVMPMLRDRPLRSTMQVIDRAAVKGIDGL